MKYQRPEIKGECPEMNVNNHKTDRKQKGYREPVKKENQSCGSSAMAAST